MAYHFSARARKVAWSSQDADRQTSDMSPFKRVGTDSTLGDGDSMTFSTSIKRLNSSDGIQSLVSALETDGCVIIEDFVDPPTLQKAGNEARPWLEEHRQSQARAPRPLISCSPTVRDHFLAHDVYQQLCDDFLTVEIRKLKCNRHVIEVSQPILSSAGVRDLPSDRKEESLIRHDASLGRKHTRAEKYKHGRDSTLGLLLPQAETIEIHAVPGSHLLGNGQPDLSNDVVVEELKMGDAMIVLGSLYHDVATQPELQNGSAPTSVYEIWSSAGVYRPEENFAASIDAAELKTYPKVVRDRLR